MHSHNGHRLRLKNRFLKESLENFSEHEVLELLLFFSIPQGDTNAIAHELINRFGSLRGVLLADTAALTEVKGIGDHSALLIKFIPAISERFALSGRGRPQILNTKAAASYVVPMLENSREEEFHIFCLDMSYRLIYHELMNRGTYDALSIQVSRVVKAAVRQDTARLLIAHTHPAGEARPSIQDINLTEKLVKSLDVVGIPLIDHIIVASGAYYSFAAGSRISTLFDDEITPAAQYASISKKNQD